MEGIRSDNELRGLIPRMFDYLFECIAKADPDIEFNIKCSYLYVLIFRLIFGV